MGEGKGGGEGVKSGTEVTYYIHTHPYTTQPVFMVIHNFHEAVVLIFTFLFFLFLCCCLWFFGLTFFSLVSIDSLIIRRSRIG